jgi:hypothetical protein
MLMMCLSSLAQYPSFTLQLQRSTPQVTLMVLTECGVSAFSLHRPGEGSHQDVIVPLSLRMTTNLE